MRLPATKEEQQALIDLAIAIEYRVTAEPHRDVAWLLLLIARVAKACAGRCV